MRIQKSIIGFVYEKNDILYSFQPVFFIYEIISHHFSTFENVTIKRLCPFEMETFDA